MDIVMKIVRWSFESFSESLANSSATTCQSLEKKKVSACTQTVVRKSIAITERARNIASAVSRKGSLRAQRFRQLSLSSQPVRLFYI